MLLSTLKCREQWEERLSVNRILIQWQVKKQKKLDGMEYTRCACDFVKKEMNLLAMEESTIGQEIVALFRIGLQF